MIFPRTGKTIASRFSRSAKRRRNPGMTGTLVSFIKLREDLMISDVVTKPHQLIASDRVEGTAVPSTRSLAISWWGLVTTSDIIRSSRSLMKETNVPVMPGFRRRFAERENREAIVFPVLG